MKTRIKIGCIVLCLLAGFAAVFTAADRQGTQAVEPAAQYIVRLRENVEPFEVMGGETLAALLSRDSVLWYEKDDELPLSAEDSSCYYESYQWNLAMIGAETAFEANAAGQGILVGVIDSGVNPHPDFGARLLPGHNYMENAKDPDDTSDKYGHGTRVAGLIAGAGEHGCIGAAPMAQIVPLKCTDGQTVRVSTLCQAIYGGIDDYGCRVLNVSMGISMDHPALAQAVEYAAEKNVVVVSGAGNGGKSYSHYPASYDSVIGVGAVDRDGTWYVRSNHHEGVSLTAPGVDVRTTDSRGGYVLATGSSFAAPQVSAAAADLLSIDGSLTPGEIQSLLMDTATDKGGEGWDEYYGAGILNLTQAVEKIRGHT